MTMQTNDHERPTTTKSVSIPERAREMTDMEIEYLVKEQFNLPIGAVFAVETQYPMHHPIRDALFAIRRELTFLDYRARKQATDAAKLLREGGQK